MKVNLISKTKNPQTIIWYDLHRCYSEDPSIFESFESHPKSEKEAGERVVRLILNKRHFGPLENPQLMFEFIGFPHSVPVQLRTHRTGIHFGVQSQRYTGKRVVNFVDLLEKNNNPTFTEKDLDLYFKINSEPSLNLKSLTSQNITSLELLKEYFKLFYHRPLNVKFTNRSGKTFVYDTKSLVSSINNRIQACRFYASQYHLGFAEEILRDDLPQGIKQGFVMSANLRTIFHLLDMRLPKDAQYEVRLAMAAVADYIKNYVPEIWSWYESKRLYKNQLAP